MATEANPIDRSPLVDSMDLDRIWNSLVVMGRVIYAVIIRESRTRHGTSALGYAWALVDPLVELGVMVLLFTAFGRVSPIPVTLPVFIVSGMLPFHFFKDCMSRGSSAASANAALLTYPQVKVSDVLLGRVFLEAATTMVIYVLFMCALKIIEQEPFSTWYDHSLDMFLCIVSIVYVGIAGAFFSSSMTRLTPLWGTIWSYMGRPLWYLSGIFFTLSTLPHNARRYMTFNPLAHMIEWWRSASLSQFESTAYSPTFVIVSATIVLFIGLAVDRMLALVGHNEGGH